MKDLRPIKYQYIEHAERNACFYAAKHGIKLEGTILWMSCNPIPCQSNYTIWH